MTSFQPGWCAVATVGLAAWLVVVGQTAGGPSPIPPEVEGNADQWPLPNKDYASTRAVLGGAISSSTAGRLDVAWVFDVPPDRVDSFTGALATNPIVIDDVVYFQDLRANVFAVNLDHGGLKWQHRNERSVNGPNGVAIGWGKVFAANGTQSIAALELATGDELWSMNLGRTAYEGIDIQPIVYDGRLYLGTAAGTFDRFYVGGTRGSIRAHDQQTGAQQWLFDTVDSADIWGNPEVNSGGGVWYPPAIDTERGITFWGIGNAGPWPGTGEFPNGTSRPGPNLYTSSIVALDHLSGELKWYNQVRPHDLFDLDFQSTPILASVSIAGQYRDIAIGSGKAGSVIAFDRDTGERLWKTDVGVHLNDDLTEVPSGELVTVFPGTLGGVETPMAYAEGTVYVPLLNNGRRYTATSQSGSVSHPDAGELVALRADTGEVLWNKKFGSRNFGGATVVNDLVFTSTEDGMIYGFDRMTGDERFRYQAPGGINGWPAVAGDTIIFPIGRTQSPRLIAFDLEPGPDTLPSRLVASYLVQDNDGDGVFDDLGDLAVDRSSSERIGVGELDVGATNSVNRLIVKYSFPPRPLRQTTLQSAVLRLYLEGLEGAPAGPLSLLHSTSQNGIVPLLAEYESADYIDTQLDLNDPTSEVGRYYEVDVTEWVLADYAAEGEAAISAFRLQISEAEFMEDDQVARYVFTMPGAEGNHPELLLTFVPEPATLFLAVIGCLASVCFGRWRPRR